MQTVYIENRSIAFCTPSEIPSTAEDNSIVKPESALSLTAAVSDFIADRSREKLFIVCDNPSEAFEAMCAPFREINAGGGVVCNGRGEYLMILRRGIWDFPKGKQERGEDIEQCALREVHEETGLGSLVLGSPICVTHHCYTLDGKFCVKHTHWYNMSLSGEESPVPQTEEEIERVCWTDRDTMLERASKSYRSISEVARTVASK